jgi:hypothetical protein
MNNFEVKYTIRIYDPSLISELATQFEKEADTYHNKNEFFTHIISLGLKDNRENRADEKPHDEKDDLYALLLKVFDYISAQFKALHVKETLLERLLCAVYNVAVAINDGETLFSEKIESGFYDDVPARFEKLLGDLMKKLGLADRP